jgi:hypothetical protein
MTEWEVYMVVRSKCNMVIEADNEQEAVEQALKIDDWQDISTCTPRYEVAEYE